MLIHPMSGLLSAWGIDKAAVRALREDAVEVPLDENCLGAIAERLDKLRASAETELAAQGLVSATQKTEVLIRYDGSDTSLPVPFDTIQTMRKAFETAHRTTS